VQCDIPGILILENNSGSMVYYTIYFTEPIEEVNKLEVEINDKSKEELIFGFGNRWTEKRLKYFFSQIDSIEIITKKDTIIMQDKMEMYHYYKKRRKGIDNYIVKIKIE
jgi:hypothetical protein